jgi:IS30 family transposase
MSKDYHHLTRDQRCQLYTLKKRGDSIAFIANEIEAHRSTIYRELKRNFGLRRYRYKQAHEKAVQRRYNASSHKPKMNHTTIAIIKEKLRLQWSPVQISGWLKMQEYTRAVSYETIYQYVWQEKSKGGFLYKELRHSGKKYNRRSKGCAGRGCIPHRIDIDERPAIVEKKIRLGDWELDTIVGTGQSGVIVSMVERTSKLTKLAKAPRRTAYEVKQALLLRLDPIKEFVLTMTADNGKEFADHQEVGKALDSEFYFAKPYHSWERGLNEHTNGLVRQYFPKNKRFDEITKDDLMNVEILLNKRPRKVLNFATPIEVFDHLAKAALNVAFQN